MTWHSVSHVACDRAAVIGDVHGRADLLEKLLDKVGDTPVFVVGDLIDRGPDSRRVVELLLERGARGVRGNHEEWFCAWVSGQGFDSFALNPHMGGAATLASYGIHSRSNTEISEQRFRVPSDHRKFLLGLPTAMRLTVAGSPYWLVHAGVSSSLCVGLDPQKQMAWVVENEPDKLLWPKYDPDEMDRLDAPVIYGHVILDEPLDSGHAIGIDTGAGAGDGALTALILPERRFVTVR